MPNLGIPELAIIMVIVVLLFGVGKLSGVGKAFGTSIREFKAAVSPEEKKEAETPPPSEGAADAE